MKLTMDEIIARCDAVVKTTLEESLLPKNLFPKDYELTIGVKILIINSFLTVLANFGDITEEEFGILLATYKQKLNGAGKKIK